MSERIENIVKEDAQIIWRNFAGNPDKFNPNGGKRTFSLVLTQDEAESLLDEGWNVKERVNKEDETDVLYTLQCRANYDGSRPPKIYLVTVAKGKKHKSLLDEDTVKVLDYAEIERVDVVISPYKWTMGNKSGISAYVKTMYVTIARDELEDLYEDDEEEEIPFS